MQLGLECGPHTLDMAVRLGIRGVPVDAQALVNDGAAKTLAPLRERELVVCQVGAFGYNGLSTDQERQFEQRRNLEKAIPLAAEAGCPYIVICGGNYHPSGFLAADRRNFFPDALDKVAQDLESMLRLAERYSVKLSIEPYLKTAVNSPETFLALYEKAQSDALRVNIDVTSLYRYEDMLDPTATVNHICTSLAGHYGLVHVKELSLANDFHIHIGLSPLGTGPTPWDRVLRLTEPHLPLDSWLILEHVATPEEAMNSVRLLRNAAASAGVTLL